MINILKDSDLFQKMSHLMNQALQNSAKALSVLIEDEVRLEGLEVKLNTNKKRSLTFSDSSTYYSVVSEIRGDISAESFLIFSQEDAQELYQKIKPSPPSDTLDMLEAILLEVANILTAAVVTSLSNFLDVSAFGGVPKLHRITQESSADFIREALENTPFSFSFKIELASISTEIYPEFIWLVREDFYKLLETKKVD